MFPKCLERVLFGCQQLKLFQLCALCGLTDLSWAGCGLRLPMNTWYFFGTGCTVTGGVFALCVAADGATGLSWASREAGGPLLLRAVSAMRDRTALPSMRCISVRPQSPPPYTYVDNPNCLLDTGDLENESIWKSLQTAQLLKCETSVIPMEGAIAARG